jgi:NAD+ diphosphatase
LARATPAANLPGHYIKPRARRDKAETRSFWGISLFLRAGWKTSVAAMLSPRAMRPLVFTASPLTRAAEERSDARWLAEKRGASAARLLPFWKMQPLLAGPEAGPASRLGFLSQSEAAPLLAAPGIEIFLGLDSAGTGHFARDVSALEDAPAHLKGLGHFREARVSLETLAADETAIMGQAKALFEWHARRTYCSHCAGKLETAEGGYRRHCGGCGADHFPRTDPAVIMVVVRGEHCLLARNKRFGVALTHSALAGFVEPGETLEEAVRREVMEEVGLNVGAVHYIASQPWPFPSSLMIGCMAEATSSEIHIDGVEIVAADWFDKATVRRLLAGEKIGDISLPRPFAIARHLLTHWAEM